MNVFIVFPDHYSLLNLKFFFLDLRPKRSDSVDMRQNNQPNIFTSTTFFNSESRINIRGTVMYHVATTIMSLRKLSLAKKQNFLEKNVKNNSNNNNNNICKLEESPFYVLRVRSELGFGQR